jgi:hypothetical protein
MNTAPVLILKGRVTYSRSQFGKLVETSLPVAAAAFSNPMRLLAATSVKQMLKGVLVGVITLCRYHIMPNDAKSAHMPREARFRHGQALPSELLTPTFG